MFNNLKISTKLFLTFTCLLALVFLSTVILFADVSNYKQTAESGHYLADLQFLLQEKQKFFLSFFSEHEVDLSQYDKIKKDFDQLKSQIQTISLDEKQRERVDVLLSQDQEISNKLFNDKLNFFADYVEARDDFIEKNNKHIRRLLGYRDHWSSPRSDKDEKILEVLNNIQQERILVEDFNVNNNDYQKTINEFRQVNDSVVGSLVMFLQNDIDDGLSKASSSAELTSKLQTLKTVISKLTATSFPVISEQESKILDIVANHQVLDGVEADNATKALNASCNQFIDDGENNNNLLLWNRGDVSDVGKNVTPIDTLLKIISCQQGLRANAEDIFSLKILFTKEIEPIFINLNEEINSLEKDLNLSLTENLSQLMKVFSVVLIVSLVIMIIFPLILFRGVIKPIVSLRNAAAEIARGNMDVVVDVQGHGEVADLAKSIDSMQKSLKIVFEEYEKKVGGKK